MGSSCDGEKMNKETEYRLPFFGVDYGEAEPQDRVYRSKGVDIAKIRSEIAKTEAGAWLRFAYPGLYGGLRGNHPCGGERFDHCSLSITPLPV